MLEHLIEQMEAVCVVLAQDQKVSHLVPQWQDCDVISAVFAAIEPLQEITDILSGEQRITSSAIKPLLKSVVYDKILVENDDDATLIKQRISSDLQSHYVSPQLDVLLDKCSFPDPRFKHNYKTEDECVQQIMAEMTTNLSQSGATEQKALKQ